MTERETQMVADLDRRRAAEDKRQRLLQMKVDGLTVRELKILLELKTSFGCGTVHLDAVERTYKRYLKRGLVEAVEEGP